MSRVRDTLGDTVFYIYPTEKDAVDGNEFGATGFFYQELSQTAHDKAYTYAVSNSHVVFDPGMEDPILRINKADQGYDLIRTAKSDWVRHPHGDDIAVCLLKKIDIKQYKIISVGREDLIDDEFIKTFNLGPGDEVVMAGRFRVHAGKGRNHPTYCFGNIASMNSEPLYNRFTQLAQESFIVEMRSIAGFSGSPVLVYIPPMSFRFNKPADQPESLEMVHRQRFLGVQWGHIIYRTKAKDASGQELLIETDSAMAGVVPAWKLTELIDSDELKQIRQKSDEAIKELMEVPSAPLDSTHPNELKINKISELINEIRSLLPILFNKR